MKTLKGKRFAFAIVAVVAVTVTAIYLKYDGDTYLKLIGSVVAVFTVSQTVTDLKNGGKNHE